MVPTQNRLEMIEAEGLGHHGLLLVANGCPPCSEVGLHVESRGLGQR